MASKRQGKLAGRTGDESPPRDEVDHPPEADDAASPEAPRPPSAGKPAPPSAPGIGEATPSMAQFLEIKTANPDSILWYRMGDFYELFFDDAVVASQALGIVLTKRGKHLGQDIPMCGVPVHRADEYLQRLIKLGFRVAVCEQLEDPAEAKKRGAKSVVRRDVVRLVTPGTLTEDSLLDAKSRNYLTAMFRVPGGPEGETLAPGVIMALASLDISTGEFEVGEVAGLDLPGELVRLSPGEVIASDALLAEAELRAWLKRTGAAATPVPAVSFDNLSGEHELKARLKVADLGAFGAFTRAEFAAIGAILRYVDLTQIGKKPVIRPPRRAGRNATLLIDAASRASLELVRSTSGERAGSLLEAIDRTVTSPGARELAARLAAPVSDPATIEARLDAVAVLVSDSLLREDLRRALKGSPDIARAISRLAFGRGGPRDLASIGQGLASAKACAHLLSRHHGTAGLPTELERMRASLARADGSLLELISSALIEDPPHLKRDGGFVRRGFRKSLDDAIALRDDSRRIMADLETRYVELSGIKSLKIRHNNILGYFIEATQTNAKPLTEPPLSDVFRHRQSMSNAMRFTTLELAEIEGRIASAAERALAIEQEVFQELSEAVAAEEALLSELAEALAELDHTAGLAELAEEEKYTRPFIDGSRAFEIRGGRHPVVEQALKRAKQGPFVANDCNLGRAGAALPPGFDEMPDARVWLVTGPNMAGKSTFLRQNALITILAQLGSFVPAADARIGVVDRLFSRVGASDDLARGRSTFMVEMVETAAILNQATSRSLVILDEIGRGTATFDGLSIAWACVEHLHDVTEARVLFATHYHELTALASRLNSVANVTMDVKEWQDDIVFLHRVKKGAADRSYGIQVAKLAGFPGLVIDRAREVLTVLEKQDRKKGGGTGGALDDLPLFAAARPKGAGLKAEPSEAERALDAISPDGLSPREALDALYRLKELRAKTKEI